MDISSVSRKRDFRCLFVSRRLQTNSRNAPPFLPLFLSLTLSHSIPSCLSLWFSPEKRLGGENRRAKRVGNCRNRNISSVQEKFIGWKRKLFGARKEENRSGKVGYPWVKLDDAMTDCTVTMRARCPLFVPRFISNVNTGWNI